MKLNSIKKPTIIDGEVLLNFDTTVLKKNTLILLGALPKGNWKISKPRADLVLEYMDFVGDLEEADYSYNNVEDLLLYRLYENYLIWKDNPEYEKVMTEEAVAVATILAVSGYQLTYVTSLHIDIRTAMGLWKSANMRTADQFWYLACQWKSGDISIEYVGEPEQTTDSAESTKKSPTQFLVDENLIDLPASLREHLKSCTSIDAIVLEVCNIMMWGPKYKRADDALSSLISAWNTAKKE